MTKNTNHTPDHPKLIGVRAVQPLTGFRVRLTFTDGAVREMDLKPYLRGPIFEPIRNDPQLFAAVQVDTEGDTITWPNGADIAPETLYYDGHPPWAQETPPAERTPRRRVTQRRSGGKGTPRRRAPAARPGR